MVIIIQTFVSHTIWNECPTLILQNWGRIMPNWSYLQPFRLEIKSILLHGSAWCYFVVVSSLCAFWRSCTSACVRTTPSSKFASSVSTIWSATTSPTKAASFSVGCELHSTYSGSSVVLKSRLKALLFCRNIYSELVHTIASVHQCHCSPSTHWCFINQIITDYYYSFLTLILNSQGILLLSSSSSPGMTVIICQFWCLPCNSCFVQIVLSICHPALPWPSLCDLQLCLNILTFAW